MKKISCILILLLLITSFSFVGAQAASKDLLEEKIIIAKSMFEIPDDYELTHNVYTKGNKMVWNLRWEKKDGKSANINVSIDENNEIISYNNYVPKKHTKKLPTITLDTAKEKAEEFIKKIDSDLMDELVFNEHISPMNLQNRQYTFNYKRLVNGIPFKENNVYVSIDNDTGQVINYNKHWYDDLEFPEPDSIISMKQAKEAYREKLGTRLCYSIKMEDDELVVYPVYATNYNNNSSVIDAFTGNKKDIYARYIHYGMGEELAMKKMEMDGRSKVVITPQEREKIEEYKELITVEKAEEIARNIPVIDLDGYVIEHKNLNKNYLNGSTHIWHLSFRNPKNEKGHISTANVSINANTEEVITFNIHDYYEYGSPTKEQEDLTYTIDDAKKQINEFLAGFVPDKYNDIEYFENDFNYEKFNGQSPKFYTLNYVRKVNGIEFLNNGITVSYDASKGKITSYRLYWNTNQIPDIDNVISLDEAYDKLFNQVGLELKYIGSYDRNKEPLKSSMGQINQIDLVYTLKDSIPSWIDANTGDIIYTSGDKYKKRQAYSYNDTDGHYAEDKIEILGNYMIGFEGGNFKPDEKTKQKDFFKMLVKVLDHYYEPYRGSSNNNETIYKILMNNNILTLEEKAPDSLITREEACKYIIRAKNLEEVANIKNIYKTGFKDEASITSDLIGYVALSKGLDIIEEKEYFKPKDNITRADCAVMIYNYLSK